MCRGDGRLNHFVTYSLLLGSGVLPQQVVLSSFRRIPPLQFSPLRFIDPPMLPHTWQWNLLPAGNTMFHYTCQRQSKEVRQSSLKPLTLPLYTRVVPCAMRTDLVSSSIDIALYVAPINGLFNHRTASHDISQRPSDRDEARRYDDQTSQQFNFFSAARSLFCTYSSPSFCRPMMCQAKIKSRISL